MTEIKKINESVVELTERRNIDKSSLISRREILMREVDLIDEMLSVFKL